MVDFRVLYVYDFHFHRHTLCSSIWVVHHMDLMCLFLHWQLNCQLLFGLSANNGIRSKWCIEWVKAPNRSKKKKCKLWSSNDEMKSHLMFACFPLSAAEITKNCAEVALCVHFVICIDQRFFVDSYLKFISIVMEMKLSCVDRILHTHTKIG